MLARKRPRPMGPLDLPFPLLEDILLQVADSVREVDVLPASDARDEFVTSFLGGVRRPGGSENDERSCIEWLTDLPHWHTARVVNAATYPIGGAFVTCVAATAARTRLSPGVLWARTLRHSGAYSWSRGAVSDRHPVSALLSCLAASCGGLHPGL